MNEGTGTGQQAQLIPPAVISGGQGYLWLQGHPKAGTPPKGTPLRSNDIDARLAKKGQDHG